MKRIDGCGTLAVVPELIFREGSKRPTHLSGSQFIGHVGAAVEELDEEREAAALDDLRGEGSGSDEREGMSVMSVMGGKGA